MTASSDLKLEQLLRDPYPAYRQLRDAPGLSFVDAIDRWAITRWEDVVHVDTHPDEFSAVEEGSLQTRVMGQTMLRADGDDHRRLRAAAADPLRPQVVRDHWQPIMRAMAEELVEGFAGDGAVELISRFAAPFAARALKVVIGLPDADDDDMGRWSQALMDGTSNYADDPAVWCESEQAAAEVDDAVEAHVRSAHPDDPAVLSSMVRAGLGPDEVRANIKLLIGGGLNEPRDAIGIAVWALLNHPAQLAAAKADPSLWSAACEEALRWISPLAVYPRQVARDTVLAGTPLSAGERVAVIVAAANRDERHWERPDEFDLTRGTRKHLGFGLGHHYCLGVWMSRRQIADCALPLLFALEDLRLDLDAPPVLSGWVFRGFTDLRLRWTP